MKGVFNKSEHIDPRDCIICGGMCCRNFFIQYPKPLNPYKESMMARFRMLDTDRVIVLEKPDSYHVIFDYPCIHLTIDGRCAIYMSEERPLLCKIYPFDEDTMCPFKK